MTYRYIVSPNFALANLLNCVIIQIENDYILKGRVKEVEMYMRHK